MTPNTFHLPDVGEGLTEAEIVHWKVQPGDTVSVNDIIVEIETAKSLVELPSPFAGVVSALLVGEGETVEVGTPIFAVEDPSEKPGSAGAGSGAGSPRVSAPEPEAATPIPAPDMPGELATPPTASRGPADQEAEDIASAAPGPLVGTGPKADAARRRPRKPASPPASSEVRASVEDPSPQQARTGSGQPVPTGSGVGGSAASVHRPQERPAESREPAANPRINPLNQLLNRVLAKPPVRKTARDLGINLADVPATGTSGEVTKQDLISYQAQRDAEQDGADTFWGGRKKFGADRIERIPVKGVRKATAKAMVHSAFTAPHVSIFVDVDASRTMEFVKRLKASRDFEGIKVSPLLILAKAVIWAAARNPSVNATWTDDEILVKHFLNLGIAAATPRGLMVPNIKDAQDLSLKELALALNELATTARAGRTQPAQMQGGTLTITNIGALGIDTGTPIINPGEVAIVAFGTIKQKPWVLDGEVCPRWITTLGGSFDHRVVDGDLSARFMADVASILEEPALLLD
ncbi:dihydrolipoamide acetyltransferase family protein [Arthrobacter sp. Br18]|uniref:dihydrolipoamide acetyltransferase family protein n=1 Tax=Arthrobacter sp. Br18 TaxID=1312954 RepID=UPI0004794307|nr:dihydrolipoamide acetyltransferase family protein [Arthrobacter sp. Br18]